MFGLDTDLTILLLFCILCACSFEFINGFHDTANAVATVIYTHSLKPVTAVIWSGSWNFLGVLFGGTAVALGILKLLPDEMIGQVNVMENVCMILSLLFSAIIWNLGTWYLGIPCSSSHTLIGSMLGVAISFTLFQGHDIGTTVNWGKAGEIGLSLLISPALGFIFTLLMVKLLKNVLSAKDNLFKEPTKDKAPPWYIRTILIITCTAVSYFHGSNDGQKGMGLMMLILIAIAPARFALDMERNPVEIRNEIALINTMVDRANLKKATPADLEKIQDSKVQILELNTLLGSSESLAELPLKDVRKTRATIKELTNNLDKSILKSELLSRVDIKTLKKHINELKSTTDHTPFWVVFLISISLGIGTMIGWKRIVTTIGEKIGKEHLSYAQGASAELIAAGTIGLATATGLPVSTTQVLSSGVAGSMVATSGHRNLQGRTVKNIFIAWLLTLPVTIALSGGLYYVLRLILI
jgi:phosphate/sulfate permease